MPDAESTIDPAMLPPSHPTNHVAAAVPIEMLGAVWIGDGAG
jgi:hypothetical protein